MTDNLEIKAKKKRNGYVTALQKERLVDFVTSNSHILFGKEVYQVGEKTKNELWDIITKELNAIGVKKDVIGWKRCYFAIKSLTNRKMRNSTQGTPE